MLINDFTDTCINDLKRVIKGYPGQLRTILFALSDSITKKHDSTYLDSRDALATYEKFQKLLTEYATNAETNRNPWIFPHFVATALGAIKPSIINALRESIDNYFKSKPQEADKKYVEMISKLNAIDRVQNITPSSSTAAASSSMAEAQQNPKQAKINIFQETLKISREKYYNEVAAMKKGAIYFESTPTGALRCYHPLNNITHSFSNIVEKSSEQTSIEVKNNDSFLVAQELINQGLSPLVLDMANKISAGGGVEHGSSAQEEDLCRCSTLYLGLEDFGKRVTQGKHQGRLHFIEEIPEFGSIYVPGVTVFRNSQDKYKLLAQTFNVDVIAIAGYDLGKLNQLESNLQKIFQTQGRDKLLKTFREYTKYKIRHMFDVALQTGHDSLVLGALSCGAFKLRDDTGEETAQQVVAAYKEVLQENQYCKAFKHISFAILANQQQQHNNFDIFNNAGFSQSAKIGSFMISKGKHELIIDPQTNEHLNGRECCEFSSPRLDKSKLDIVIQILQSNGLDIYQTLDYGNYTRIKINPANYDALVIAVHEINKKNILNISASSSSSFLQSGTGASKKADNQSGERKEGPGMGK